jgi:hypothetical protein
MTVATSRVRAKAAVDFFFVFLGGRTAEAGGFVREF